MMNVSEKSVDWQLTRTDVSTSSQSARTCSCPSLATNVRRLEDSLVGTAQLPQSPLNHHIKIGTAQLLQSPLNNHIKAATDGCKIAQT